MKIEILNLHCLRSVHSGGGVEGSNEIPACLFIFFGEINLSQCDGPIGPNRNI